MATAVVLGGGVSGLAAAYYLQRLQSRFAKVIVLEGKSRVGGWVNTTRTADGAKFEHGPRSFRPAGQSGVNTIDLVDELGLSREVLSVPTSHPSAKYRYIYKDGKCHPLPSGITSVMKTVPPFSRPWVVSLASEPFKAPSTEPDESIDSFVRRRLGAEIADYAINPMCRGIFAGDSKVLSVRSCMPPLFAFEKDDGSIVKGTIWPSKGRNRPERRTALSQRAKSDGWAAWSLKEGSAQLTDTMLQAVSQDPRVEVRTGSPVTSVSPIDGKLQVKTDGETIKADHVFSSIYSAALSEVLPVEMKELRETLSSIPSSTVAVINLEYAGHVLPFQGFGHLLPSSEDKKMLGIVYDSCVFPQHDRPDQPTTRLTCMMGGAWFSELKAGVTDLTDDYLLSLATEAVSTHLGISAKPARTIVNLQKDCIPQYLVGHWQKLEAIDSLTESARLPISYIGASYRGPSVNDCIYNAKLEVEKVVSASFAV